MTATDTFAAMRSAAKRAGDLNKSVIEILASAYKSTPDETIVANLRYEYLIGSLMGECGIGDNSAIDYLPALGAKPGQKGKWSDYPVKAPETYDASKHRPLPVHNAYRARLTAWSDIRKSAGLPSLKAPSTKAPQTPTGAKNDTRGIGAFKTSDLDTRGVLAIVKSFADIMDAAINGNAARVVGQAGSLERKLMADLHSYVGDITAALVTDQPVASMAASIEAAETAKTLAETRAMLATMRAELAASREREVQALAEKDARAASRNAKRVAKEATAA